MPNRPKAPKGAENKTIPASGGQPITVSDTMPTPSMTGVNSATTRRQGKVLDPVTGSHVFD